MHDPRTARPSNIDILRIVLIYIIFSGLWILVSDQVTEWLFGGTSMFIIVSTLKGWLFVAVTSALLYLLLKHTKYRGGGFAAPRRIPGLVDWRPWQLYLFATVVSLITMLVRTRINVPMSEHPMMILLMLPIILSAALGGIGPGVFATILVALFTAYYIPPFGSFRIEQPHDVLQLGFLLANGLIVSFLSTMLHQARQRSERERQKAELALAEKSRALELLNSISTGSTDAIFAKDLDGRYLMVNAAALHHMGKPEQDVLGKDDTNLLPPDQAMKIMAMDRRLLASGQGETFEYEATTVNGTRSFMTTKGLLHDETGKVVGLYGIARDISEIKAIEIALRRERDRNQRYLDSMQTIMLALDTEGFITMINRYGRELLGYQESELLGKNWFTTCLRQPEGSEVSLPLYQHILAGDLDGNNLHENEIMCRDGSIRTISWHITNFRNEVGNIVGTLSSGEDITERKKAEDALRISEETYRSLFENMLNGFAYCQMHFENDRPLDFTYLSVNKAFSDQTGLKDVVGRKVSDVIPGIREADPNLFETYGRVARTGKPEHFETYVQALDMWFSISVYSPKPEHFVAVFDVITERKKAELAIRQSEERFRTLFDNSSIPFMIHDKDSGAILDANRVAIEFFGCTTLEELQQSDMWLEPPYSLAEAVKFIRQAGNGAPQRFEWKNRNQQGRFFWHDVQLSRIILNDVERVLSTSADITQRKEAEAELRRRNEELERFNRVTVGRELDMIRLKKQINELSLEMGKKAPYNLTFTNETGKSG